MNQAQLVDIWKEIVATANNGDPQHSYRLFAETVNKSGE